MPPRTDRLSELELRAWQGLLHTFHDVTDRLDAELRAEHDLSLGSYDVLLRLARAPGRSLRMADLADRALVSRSGLTRRVDRLVARRFVSRVPDPEDGRGALALLTGAGHDALRAAARTHLRGIREWFTGRLSPAQLRQVASALEAVAGPHEPH